MPSENLDGLNIRFALYNQTPPERPCQPRPDRGDGGDVADGRVEEALVEGQDHEELLDVHLDHGLACGGGWGINGLYLLCLFD